MAKEILPLATGVDIASREALNHFFNHDLPQLPAEIHLAIAQDLREREWEAAR